MSETRETIRDEAERLLTGITPGEWRYRPLDFDDWGFVRSEIGDELVAVGRCSLPESEADRHRAGGTDPYRANGEFVAASPRLIRSLLTSHADLLAALKASHGYLLNAKIDLQSGVTKQTAIGTIDGGLHIVQEAIERAEAPAR